MRPPNWPIDDEAPTSSRKSETDYRLTTKSSRAKARRRRSLTRSAFQSGVIVALVVIVSAASSIGLARADPNRVCIGGPGCPGGGGGGGGCPSGGSGSLTLASSTQVNETNATVYFWLTSASHEPSGTASMRFGLNTSYSLSGANGTGVYESREDIVPLDFLKPNATYYYSISATAVCTLRGRRDPLLGFDHGFLDRPREHSHRNLRHHHERHGVSGSIRIGHHTRLLH